MQTGPTIRPECWENAALASKHRPRMTVDTRTLHKSSTCNAKVRNTAASWLQHTLFIIDVHILVTAYGDILFKHVFFTSWDFWRHSVTDPPLWVPGVVSDRSISNEASIFWHHFTFKYLNHTGTGIWDKFLKRFSPTFNIQWLKGEIALTLNFLTSLGHALNITFML